MGEKYALGLDFGTDSVRALIVNVDTGEEVGTSVNNYKRWADKLFCNLDKDQYRQHPLDYIEGLEAAVNGALSSAIEKTKDKEIGNKVIGIGIDTTGSTPVAVDKTGKPLSMLDEFKEDPNAMFILWKDHTAVAEAEKINKVSKEMGINITKYCGGTYSSEWFWSKILHTMKTADKKLVDAAYSWVEHCDWVAALLSGDENPAKMKRSRCAAGHKALWHRTWGLPFDFLKQVDPVLGSLEGKLYVDTYTSDTKAGNLSKSWAERLGLKEGIPITAGAFDAHMGAVGNGIKPGMLSRIVGTSTCDMVVAPYDKIRIAETEKLIKGICGQVDGSIIPGMYGLEAGQSAVGDIFANFRDMFVDRIIRLGLATDKSQIEEIKNKIYSQLMKEAENLKPNEVPLVIDYHNGRRTPNADQRLTGAALGLTLGTDAPKYFAGLVQGTCYTARQIMETFTSQGIAINEVIACGGIADKNPYVMQTMADAMNVPISVAKSEQTCALGAAMFGAVVGGAYKTVQEAQEKMGSGFKAKYAPRDEFSKVHNERYKLFIEAVKINEALLRTIR